MVLNLIGYPEKSPGWRLSLLVQLDYFQPPGIYGSLAETMPSAHQRKNVPIPPGAKKLSVHSQQGL